MIKQQQHIYRRNRATQFLRAAAVVLCCCGMLPVRAAILGNGAPRETVDGIAIPVTLITGADDTIASMQFSLTYDTRAFALAGALAGPAAAQAGKDVIYAQHNGSATIIIAGFNQDILQGGLVATVYLQPLGDLALPGSVGIRGAVFSDPLGNAVVPKDPDGNTTDPEPSPGPSPAEEDVKSTPPPEESVNAADGENSTTNTPRSNYVNPGYSTADSDNGFGTDGRPSAQAGDDNRRGIYDSGPIIAGSGGGPIPGAGSRPASSPNSSGGIPVGAYSSPPGTPTNTVYPSGRPSLARNTGSTPQNVDGSSFASPSAPQSAGARPGVMASNVFHNGTDRARKGLVFDSTPTARVTQASKSPVPLLLALVVATLFAGGAFYWRQAAPRARR